jgi:hypothetical protein
MVSLNRLISVLLFVEVGWAGEQGFVLASIVDLNLVRRPLHAGNLARVTVEAGVETAVGNARIDMEMYFLADVKFLDRPLWWRGASVPWIVGEFLACAFEGSVG